MRYREILKEMSYTEAKAIWQKFGGGDPTTIPSSELAGVRRRLIMKAHPDTGGSLKDAQEINAAYDVLKKPGAATAAPASGDWTERPRSRQRNWHYSPGDNERRDREKEESGDDRWAWAGYSGGMRNSAHIYRQDYTDVNYIKKRMWELSGKSTEEWTIWGFDGAFLRGVTTVYGSPKIFAQMAEAMITWQTKGGNPYSCRAVLVEKEQPYRSKPFDDEEEHERTAYVIWADGVFYDKKPIPITYDTFNANPGNDRSFNNRLRRLLDELQEQGGRAHEQPSMGMHGETHDADTFETGSYVVHPKHGIGRVINPEIRKGMARVAFKKKGETKTGTVKASSLRKANEREVWQFKHGE